MRKLLGKPTADHPSLTDANSTIGSASSPSLAHLPRRAAPQTTTYSAGGPIDALDTASDGRSVVLAGRHVLRTIQVDGPTIRSGVDLRALITSQSATNKSLIGGASGSSSSSSGGSAADQLSIRDAKWSRNSSDAPSIFTACANGKIFRYDVGRASSGDAGAGALETIQIREDARQVNTLHINPHRGTYLLSGSQDGVVRCFDIRQPFSKGGSGVAVRAFKCSGAEGVRRVKWSPQDGMLFACGTEAGLLFTWDIRKANSPLLRIQAHDKACASLDWHPDGDHIVTGGADGKCHVWDVSRSDKRQKPRWTVSGPAPISVVSWRPGQWSATAQARRVAQIAVCYDEGSQKRHGMGAVHLWDFARPTLPFKEVSMPSNRSPSAMLWHDTHLLWTAGQEGQFVQSDVANSPALIDRQSFSAFDFSSRGGVLMFLDERPQGSRVRPQNSSQQQQQQQQQQHPTDAQTHALSSSYSSGRAMPMMSLSRSESEDDMLGKFLAPKKRGSRRRRPSTRSTRNLSTTPPSLLGMPDDNVLSLDQALSVTGIYRSQQAMAVGRVPAGTNVGTYEYLSVRYLETLKSDLPAGSNPSQWQPLVDRVVAIAERFARAAEDISQFRLAQMWRILGYAVRLLLVRRAQCHYELRMAKIHTAFFKPKAKGSSDGRGEAVDGLPMSGDVTPGRREPRRATAGRSLLAEEIESTSNVPTPLARPADQPCLVNDSDGQHTHQPGKKLTPVLESESFTLGPAIVSMSAETRRRLDSMPLSTTSQDSGDTYKSSVEGYDFYDVDAGTAAIDVPGQRQHPVRILDLHLPSTPPSGRLPVHRHDSDESLTQMFSVSEGSKATTDRSGPTATVGQTGRERANEYASRARGRAIINDSPGRGRQPAPPAPPPQQQQQQQQQQQRPTRHAEQQAALPQSMQEEDAVDGGLTQATDEHHIITQTTASWSPDSRRSIQPEGAGTSTSAGEAGVQYGGPAAGDSFVNSSLRESFPPSPPRSVDGTLDDDTAPHIIEMDYLPWTEEPPYPHPVSSSKFPTSLSPALRPADLVSQALAFEARTSPLNASAIVLLLKPLMPADTIDDLQAAAILRQHHARLMSMGLFVEAALLRKLCIKGWPGGALSTWGDDHPVVYAQAQLDGNVAFLCSTCRKPRETSGGASARGKGSGVWQCERCAAVMAPCAVCGHRDTTPNVLPSHDAPERPRGTASGHQDRPSRGGDGRADEVMSTWWYCPGCRHGGHSTCLMGWHAAYDDDMEDLSGGCCPLDGCGHACLPGPWRDASNLSRSDDVSRLAIKEARQLGSSSLSLAHSYPLLHGGSGDDPSPAGPPGPTSAPSSGRASLEALAGPQVRADGLDTVAASRAVESVRGVLGDGGGQRSGGGRMRPRGSGESLRSYAAANKAAGAQPMTRTLSSSPGSSSLRGGLAGFAGAAAGLGGGERERRKSVKFVATEDTDGTG
jgi:WD40 repeat protein